MENGSVGDVVGIPLGIWWSFTKTRRAKPNVCFQPLMPYSNIYLRYYRKTIQYSREHEIRLLPAPAYLSAFHSGRLYLELSGFRACFPTADILKWSMYILWSTFICMSEFFMLLRFFQRCGFFKRQRNELFYIHCMYVYVCMSIRLICIIFALHKSYFFIILYFS